MYYVTCIFINELINFSAVCEDALGSVFTYDTKKPTFLACLLWYLALREVKESKPLIAFGQCEMKLVGSNIIFSNWRLILKIK